MIRVDSTPDENQRRRQREEENRRKRSSSQFDQLFRAACREVREEVSGYHFAGYTRDAKSYEYQEAKRTYL
ncbi:MAG: hypothetical protein K2O73_07485 [Lachnospiraceae bacterium]|nr:hypothetical protein [Lachnospiraceae bacterium]MDE7436549.1 hypothetical protein [Lachnospiraceae bacterium]